MKKWGMAVLVVLFLSVAGGKTSVVYGNSFSETDGQDVEEEQITESMLQRIGASKVQDFLDKQENLSDVSFSSLVIGILKGEEGISPEIPAGAPKNLLVFWRGDFFLAAPGESKFIPGRGNPRWSTKNLSSQKDGLSTAPVIKLNKQSKKSNTGK